jgi:ubiquinone/menaquinone biosynthesis C-methylase UbiE
MTTPKTDYGIDAPMVLRSLTIGGVIALTAGLAVYAMVVPARPVAGAILSIAGFFSGFCMLVQAGLMAWWSKSAKLRERERLIDALELVGNEKVLDVGCGRGLLLNGVARRLPRGMAFGIDLWQTVDQSGNSPEAALVNSKAENVADRVDVITADMRDLPFPDGSMDAVISSIAIHNVRDRDGRAKAIREIARVLKPNGRVALQDFFSAREYLKTLTDLGWKDIKSSVIFVMLPSIRILTGRKP